MYVFNNLLQRNRVMLLQEWEDITFMMTAFQMHQTKTKVDIHKPVPVVRSNCEPVYNVEVELYNIEFSKNM